MRQPCYRHTTGELVPAVALPEDLEDAMARAVLERVKMALSAEGNAAVQQFR